MYSFLPYKCIIKIIKPHPTRNRKSTGVLAITSEADNNRDKLLRIIVLHLNRDRPIVHCIWLQDSERKQDRDYHKDSILELSFYLLSRLARA